MVDQLRKRTNVSKEEEEKVNLSFDTVEEVKELCRTNPKATNIIKDLGVCCNRDLTEEYLDKFDLTDSTKKELPDHLLTVAAINTRAESEAVEV